jgi:hypothetical protein
MTPRTWLVFIVAGIALAQASPARAADTPCADDVRKLCADVPAGQARVQACLKEHESEISSACREKIERLAQEIRTAAAVCRWDIGRLCSDVSPGDGRVLSCLQNRESDLSPECKSELENLKK